MADYYSTCRTNYFKVKNEQKFRDWAKSLCSENLEVIEKDGGVGLMFDNGEPTLNKKDEEIDFFTELKAHLKKGEVAVYEEAGAEKHRYVTGYAVAVTPGKKDLVVNMNDIYDLVKRKFKPKKFTTAEY
jgi:uncharacterized protein (DUF927 family)